MYLNDEKINCRYDRGGRQIFVPRGRDHHRGRRGAFSH